MSLNTLGANHPKGKLKPKPGYKISSKSTLKEINGYTEVVFEEFYEKMTTEEIKAKEDLKKKSVKITAVAKESNLSDPEAAQTASELID